MKRTLYLIFIFLIAVAELLAQNTTRPDTLAKKSGPASADSTVKKETVAVKVQEQPANKKARKDTRPIKDRIDFDLGTSFWMNTNQVFGEVSLLVSYRFPKILSIGAGPTYIFSYQRDYDRNLNGWGGKIFVRAQLLKFIYLWTEYQGIDNQYITDWNPYTVSSGYVDSWFLGAGLNIRLGRRFGINMSVLYDVLHGSTSPYNSATTYRLGFAF